MTAFMGWLINSNVPDMNLISSIILIVVGSCIAGVRLIVSNVSIIIVGDSEHVMVRLYHNMDE